MIAACMTVVAALLPPGVCDPTPAPPPPPPPRVVAVDRPYGAAVLPEPDPVPDVWYALAVCESGMNGVPRWDYNGGSGFDGGLQFSPGTWTSYGGGEFAAEAWAAAPAEQVTVAERVLAGQGWGAWPSCSRKLGLR